MLIREHSSKIIEADAAYTVWICAEERTDGTWEGWVEFHPSTSTKPILYTERETSQPNRTAIEYWAEGIEPAYLEGAFARARTQRRLA